MHSYQHNIKTFNNATRHLTRVERSLYRDLIELYYDSEKPLPADNFDRLARLALANTDEEKAALRYVLSEFFTESSGLYVHDYCDEQIEKFYNNTTAKALAGKASAKARLEKQQQRKRERENEKETDAQQNLTDVEQNPTNHKPETRNHNKPETNLKDLAPQAAPPASPEKKSRKPKSELDYSVWGESIDQQLLTDWLTVRRTKRAAVTQTVLDTAVGEFRKAASFGYTVNDCLRCWVAAGWQGFKFEWMQNQLTKTGGNHAGQPKPSLIDRFIKNNYVAGSGFENDNRPMGGDDRVIRGEVVEPVRGDSGRLGAVAPDLIGDFKATSGSGFE